MPFFHLIYFPQERAKRMLLEHQLVLEEFGGDIQAVPISALKVSAWLAHTTIFPC
jgi:hypothetical protein